MENSENPIVKCLEMDRIHERKFKTREFSEKLRAFFKKIITALANSVRILKKMWKSFKKFLKNLGKTKDLKIFLEKLRKCLVKTLWKIIRKNW